jgi:hypothetical protein
MILVLSVYRSGSTDFCQNIANKQGYENLDEAFHESIADHHISALRYLIYNRRRVVKVFPYHVQQSTVPDLLDKLKVLANRIIFLVRDDFTEQCKSYYVAKQLANWHDNFSQPRQVFFNQDGWNAQADFLQQQYVQLASWFQNTPGAELISTADLDSTNKYIRPVTWDQEPDQIDFTPSLIFRKHHET